MLATGEQQRQPRRTSALGLASARTVRGDTGESGLDLGALRDRVDGRDWGRQEVKIECEGGRAGQGR